jgi:predicted CxxxxCH...CXXCH cytochrome family protein
MPSIRVALLAAAASVALVACGESREVEGEQAGNDCASCHGFPPAGLVEAIGGAQVQHPDNVACYGCHAATVHATAPNENELIEGGAHLNGISGDIVVTGACTECHGFPPPPGYFGRPGTDHPSSDSCWACHGTTVTSNNSIIPAEQGGTHYNGTVDQSGGHPAGYANPAVHGPDANDAIATCTECHGATYGGGIGPSCTACHQAAGFADWQTNCTFCHGTQTPAWTSAQLALAAPPEGANGQTDRAHRAVGAHQKHLAGASTLSSGFDCSECHPAVSDLGHVGPPPADVVFGARATTGGATPVYTPGASPTCSSTYCHGRIGSYAGATATWTSTAALTCSSCHGAPPNRTSDYHVLIQRHAAQDCSVCHQGYTVAGTPTVNQAKHVDGVGEAVVQATAGGTVTIDAWDANYPVNCNACHTALGRGPILPPP